VLIIEDSPDAAEIFAILVEREGFRPVVCGTAAAGMAAFAHARPVAVILDWTLPDRPGIDVCRNIRAQDQAVPIISQVDGTTKRASLEGWTQAPMTMFPSRFGAGLSVS